MMANFCSECGSSLVPNAKFCSECGTAIVDTNTQSPAVNVAQGVAGNLMVAGRDVIIGKDEREEQYRVVVNWDQTESMRNFDLSGRDLSELKLVGADLQGAILTDAVLRNCDLWKANLKNVEGLTDQQLMEVYSLRAATMPDGRTYDGRYNLNGDIERAKDPFYKIDINSPAAMARFYKVSLFEYEQGQDWAQNNL